MFTIYTSIVGGRRFDTYFRSWERAKEALEDDVRQHQKSGWVITRKLDCMNHEKGFYEYQYDFVTPDNEKATLALIDGHFSD